MEKIKKQQNENIANSYFQLAQIFGIFVGGLLVMTGLFIPSMSFREAKAFSGNLCGGEENISLCEKLVHKQLNIDHAFSGFFIFLTLLIAIDSFIFWLMGNAFLRGKKMNENKNIGYLILFNIIYIVATLLTRILSYIEFA